MTAQQGQDLLHVTGMVAEGAKQGCKGLGHPDFPTEGSYWFRWGAEPSSWRAKFHSMARPILGQPDIQYF